MWGNSPAVPQRMSLTDRLTESSAVFAPKRRVSSETAMTDSLTLDCDYRS
jgi:hypothetical protein